MSGSGPCSRRGPDSDFAQNLGSVANGAAEFRDSRDASRRGPQAGQAGPAHLGRTLKLGSAIIPTVFTVGTRSSEGLARTGVLHLAHGKVRTPAFVPLATKGAVRTLESSEVAALGYELILGNTFHLLLSPGPELVERFGGLHRFMRWDRAIVTDSGGFQVFSMAHGGVADEIKGRRGRGGAETRGVVLSLDEVGVRF